MPNMIWYLPAGAARATDLHDGLPTGSTRSARRTRWRSARVATC
jgi:hypothetical protein